MTDTRFYFNCTGCFTTLPYTKLHSAYFYQNGSASHRAWSLAWVGNYPCHYGFIGQFRLSNHETVAFVQRLEGLIVEIEKTTTKWYFIELYFTPKVFILISEYIDWDLFLFLGVVWITIFFYRITRMNQYNHYNYNILILIWQSKEYLR